MAFTEKKLVVQSLGTATSTLYTTPADTTTILRDIHVCNNSTANCYFSLWLVPSGTSATDSNVMFKEWDVPANDFVHWTGWQVLNVGDTIQGLSENDGQITVHISGAEIT